ncbi:MAG: hypothetical protein ACOVRM_04345, partial [Planctomycetaceae bacterium]
MFSWVGRSGGAGEDLDGHVLIEFALVQQQLDCHRDGSLLSLDGLAGDCAQSLTFGGLLQQLSQC